MKSLVSFLSIVTIAAILFTGCNKNDEDLYNDKEMADEVAEEIAGSLSEDNGGLTEEIYDIIEDADSDIPEYSKATDTLGYYSNTIQKENPFGTLITYSFNYDLEYGYIFDNFQLSSFFYNSDADGEFDAPRLASEANRSSTWEISNFEFAYSYYSLNGTSSLVTSSQSKIRNKVKVTSQSALTIQDVQVDKSSYEILDGTIAWKIAGSVDDQAFDYNASLEFLGDGTVKLNINGYEYIIDLESGDIEYLA
jgi:hypothetical protein